MNFRRQRRENLEISITPMIDVVFLLLIFFMVTTTFNRETELQIQLPEAAGQEPVEKEVIEIGVDAENKYYVNKHPVVNQTLDMLKKAITEAAADNKKPILVIAADAKSSHQAVIRVLDAAKQLDFVNITFATKLMPETE